jgi:hypothetical protein
MRKVLLLLPLLTVLPLSAENWEVGLFVGQQAYPSASADDGEGNSLTAGISKNTVYGLRVSRAFAEAGDWSFQGTAAYWTKPLSAAGANSVRPARSLDNACGNG